MSSFLLGGLPTLNKNNDLENTGEFKKKLANIVHHKEQVV
jgi:hypothetical protein